eukprot:scaffold47379_cov67-Phaeocystis_antarctica.AAC.7
MLNEPGAEAQATERGVHLTDGRPAARLKCALLTDPCAQAIVWQHLSMRAAARAKDLDQACEDLVRFASRKRLCDHVRWGSHDKVARTSSLVVDWFHVAAHKAPNKTTTELPSALAVVRLHRAPARPHAGAILDGQRDEVTARAERASQQAGGRCA